MDAVTTFFHNVISAAVAQPVPAAIYIIASVAISMVVKSLLKALLTIVLFTVVFWLLYSQVPLFHDAFSPFFG